MAAARFNRPSILIYGGSMATGRLKDSCEVLKLEAGAETSIGNSWEAWGGVLAGKIDDTQYDDIVRHACPSAGSCSGLYTANSMGAATEALGMSLPYSSCTPALDGGKEKECSQMGKYMLNLLELDLKVSARPLSSFRPP